MKPRPLTPDEVKGLGDGAELIRKHLWLGTTPPPPPHPSQPPWTMAKCLWIWKQLLFSGRTPEEINGAIAHARDVLTYEGPVRMTIFWQSNRGTPILEQALGLWHKRQESKPKIIPSIKDIFRELAK